MAARIAGAAGYWQDTRPAGATTLAALACAVRRAWQVVATRHLLAEMDDRMLADIGVSRAEAQLEANRAPWDVADRR